MHFKAENMVDLFKFFAQSNFGKAILSYRGLCWKKFLGGKYQSNAGWRLQKSNSIGYSKIDCLPSFFCIVRNVSNKMQQYVRISQIHERYFDGTTAEDSRTTTTTNNNTNIIMIINNKKKYNKQQHQPHKYDAMAHSPLKWVLFFNSLIVWALKYFPKHGRKQNESKICFEMNCIKIQKCKKRYQVCLL